MLKCLLVKDVGSCSVHSTIQCILYIQTVSLASSIWSIVGFCVLSMNHRSAQNSNFISQRSTERSRTIKTCQIHRFMKSIKCIVYKSIDSFLSVIIHEYWLLTKKKEKIDIRNDWLVIDSANQKEFFCTLCWIVISKANRSGKKRLKKWLVLPIVYRCQNSLR